MEAHEQWRADLAEREQDRLAAELEERPTNREAATSIAAIIERLAASRGVELDRREEPR
jgi:hypothetical protein